jgi:hypothetical protein
MISKFVEITPHKIFGVVIDDSTPVFQCQLHQIFVTSTEEYKNDIHRNNDSTLIFGLSWPEFLIMVEQFSEYVAQLKINSDVVKELSEVEK